MRAKKTHHCCVGVVPVCTIQSVFSLVCLVIIRVPYHRYKKRTNFFPGEHGVFLGLSGVNKSRYKYVSPKIMFFLGGYIPNSTVLLRDFCGPFLTLVSALPFPILRQWCPAAFAHIVACGMATTQPSAQLPSTHQRG